MGDEIDPCECVWNHELAMRRLISLVSSLIYCDLAVPYSPAGAVVLHGRRVSGRDQRAPASGVVGGRQLPHGVPRDGAGSRHVRDASAPAPAGGRQTQPCQLSGPRRSAPHSTENLIQTIATSRNVPGHNDLDSSYCIINVIVECILAFNVIYAAVTVSN